MGNAQTLTSCGRQVDRKVSSIPQHEFLSEKQKLLALNTWAHLCRTATPTQRGMRVFVRIFEIHPPTKDLFPFKKLEGSDLEANAMFKGHATRFMKAVEFTMQNLDALDVIVIPTLVSIGHKHVHIKGFHPDYLDVFQTALLDIWEEDLGRKFIKDMREAWSKIFGLITRKVYEGYMEEDNRLHNMAVATKVNGDCVNKCSKLPQNGLSSHNPPSNNNSTEQAEPEVDSSSFSDPTQVVVSTEEEVPDICGNGT